jgi:hypothetical protein
MKSADAERQWKRLAVRVSRVINLGWWAEMLATPLLLAGLVGGCAALLVRHEWPQDPRILFAAAGALVVLCALIAYLRARRRFESAKTAMVRLEASMHLRNALSAAAAGVRPWPEAPARASAGLHWRWPRLLVPPFAAIGLLALGLLLPVSRGANQPVSAPPEPLAWRQIQADLTQLDEDQTVDPAYLEEIAKKLDDLRGRQPEEWFSHSSLEATDQLKQGHQAEAARLERAIERAERALNALQNNAQGLPEAERARLLNEFDQALEAMREGAMQPNKELLEQLGNLDPSALQQLDPQQLDQLRENMRKKAGELAEAGGEKGKGGQGGEPGEEFNDELLAGEGEGQGNGQGQGQGNGPGQGEGPGDGPGQGGVGRGPGTSPNLLGKNSTDIPAGDVQGLQSKDLSNTLPGDLLELQDAKHQVDESPAGQQSGGTIARSGSGGDEVWKEPLDPDEQNALRRFFR